MRSIQSMVGRQLTWAAAAGVVAALLPLGRAGAQAQRAPTRPDIVSIVTADGSGPDLDLRTVKRGFNLFGSGDAAVTGMRGTGNLASSTENYGPCADGFGWGDCQGEWYVSNPGVTNRAPFFEGEWFYAAPPSAYVKIKQVAPSISNALGGGWTGGSNMTVLGGYARRFGPADGTLGKMFSGATVTADGSCTDHTSFGDGYQTTGWQLLPGSDCPVTWGSDGWKGSHPIDAEGYKALFDAQGDNFRWDYWRVPEANQRLDKQFLGTRFTGYGETSDYSSDVLAGYGEVVPGGTGAPSSDGYPLGLLLHFEVFNFGVPTVNDAWFARVSIINRSADVWGQGIDYDSIYLGMDLGTLFSTQNVSRYAAPELGLMMYHNNNAQGAGGPCDDAYRNPEGGGSAGCSGDTYSLRGYGASGLAVIYLASPLGDLRNKLFTRTLAGTPCTVGVDPFCNPGHPNAGDTLTFNHQSFGDYNSALVMAWNNGARSVFGYIAGDETDALAGRDPAALSDRHLWRFFRSEDWPGSSTLVGSPNKAHFNKYVPPSSPPWDYNKDGVPDTLAIATCGRLGCAGMDSDTLPGGWINRRGNIGGHQTVGPFALAAGDTTALIYAVVGGGDSTELWSQIKATEDLYMTFYLAPDAPPPVNVVSTQVTPGSDQFGTASPVVNLYYSDAPETWVDPFLMKTAEDIEAAPAGTYYGMLNADNPWLADSLRAIARNNLRRLEIYKSCDAGSSWTSDGNCDGDPTGIADTLTSGFGWRTYAVFDVDANNGDIPNVFSDANVDGGKTYLYAFVGRSRGATMLVDSGGTPAYVSFEPAIANALSRSVNDPNVASVYVPVSRPAGFQAASVDTTELPPSTVPFALTLSDQVDSAAYRAVFGTDLMVQRDSLTTGSGVRSFVTVRRRETVDASGAGVDSIIRRETFNYDNPLPFLVTADPADITDLGTATLAGDTVRVTTLYGANAPGTGLAFVFATMDGTPLFGSTQLTAGKSTPPALYGRAEYPGFTVSADNSVAGSFDAAVESQYRGPETRAELGLTDADTIIPRARVNANMVQWIEASSSAGTDGFGNYSIAWGDDPFGVARGFVINVDNPAATQADVQATLNARQVMATGLTDQATADLLGVPQTDLVPIKMPFTIHNNTFDRDVSVAMERRTTNRIALGRLTDTISVEVPDDVWVPGDVLYFIENVTEDSTVGGRLVMDSPTQPHQWTHPVETFSEAVLGCQTPRLTCNPIVQGTTGATGYEPMRAGDSTRFGYYAPFTATTEYQFAVNGAVSGDQITAVTDSALQQITVVPNPFVIFSTYQTDITNSRLAFTHLPSRGTLRIYTVNAQLVQEITWEPADLQGDGDLFWNMHTREGIDVASGLYIWVLTAPTNPNDPTSTPLRARGKFVVIRGDAQ